MESFLTLRTEREGWNSSLTKNTKNRTERDDRSSTQNGTEWDRLGRNGTGGIGTEQNGTDWDGTERKQND